MFYLQTYGLIKEGEHNSFRLNKCIVEEEERFDCFVFGWGISKEIKNRKNRTVPKQHFQLLYDFFTLYTKGGGIYTEENGKKENNRKMKCSIKNLF